jgi:hypothetical protein
LKKGCKNDLFRSIFMKTNQSEAIARLKVLYGKKGESQIFARMVVSLPADLQQRLERRVLEVSIAELPSMATTFPIWEEYLSFFDRLEDDWVPSIYAWQYDQGIYGTLFGAPIHVNRGGVPGCASSTTYPLEDLSYEELLKRAAHPDDAWVRRLESDLREVSARAGGRWGISIPITIDGFNLGMQIRGNQTLLDIHDCPRELKEFLQAGVRLNIDLVERQRSAIGRACDGGVCDFFNAGWMPRQGVPMSVDCYSFCKPEVYEEFGRPYQQQLVDHFGGGNFHIHGNGRYLLPQLAKVKGCVVSWIGDDGSDVPAMDELDKIKRQAGDVIPVVGCSRDRFEKQLREKSLVGGVYYHVSPLESIDAANRLMESVRNYRV